MGQKCNPISLRLGLNKNWLSRWHTNDDKTRIKWILEDEKVKKFLQLYCEKAGVGLIEIERCSILQEKSSFSVFVHLAQPTIFSIEKEEEYMRKEIKKIVGKNLEIDLKILELKNPNVSAPILAQEMARMLENRTPFRVVMKKTLKKALSSGAKGIKIKITGRLNGAEMSRSEGYSEGSIPLSTLRADIDYCYTVAKTTYGVLGVKVWVNRGLYFGKHFMPLPEAPQIVRRSEKNIFISKTY